MQRKFVADRIVIGIVKSQVFALVNTYSGRVIFRKKSVARANVLSISSCDLNSSDDWGRMIECFPTDQRHADENKKGLSV